MRSMYGLGCVSCSPCRPVRQACKAQGENSQDACACMRSGTELTLLQHRASERGSIRDCRHQLWDRQGHEGLSRQTLILISRQICVGPALMAEIPVAMCRDMPRPHTMVPSSSRPPTKAGSELHPYTAGPKNTTPPPSKRLRNDPVTNPDNEEGPNLAGKAGCYTGSISAPPNLCKKNCRMEQGLQSLCALRAAQQAGKCLQTMCTNTLALFSSSAFDARRSNVRHSPKNLAPGGLGLRVSVQAATSYGTIRFIRSNW